MASDEHSFPQITTENFEAEVLKFPGVVLVDFWAAWCGPCRAMAPRVAELASKYEGNKDVKIVEVDVDTQSELSERFQVLSIPTFKIFVKGEPGDQKLGLIPYAHLEDLVKSGLAKLEGGAKA